MPERPCDTCKFWQPYEGSARLRATYAKCSASKVPDGAEFAETMRGIPSLCGPDGLWWERKPPMFEVIEEERDLAWDEEDEPEEED